MKKHILLLILVIVFPNLKSQVPEYVPTKGLLGWWPLDGNAIDSSTNQNHGVVDGATPAKDRFGQSNKAFEFDGIDDEITFEVKQISSLSISVWQKPIDKGEAYDPIFQLRKDCISQGYDRNMGAEMYTLKRDGEVKIVSKLGDRKCNHTSSTIGGFVPNAIASFDKWSHYVMTINGSTKEATIYHNGKLATHGGFPFELDIRMENCNMNLL